MANIYFDFDMTLGYRTLMWTATLKDLLFEENIVVDETDLIPFNQCNDFPWCHYQLSHKDFLKNQTWWAKIQSFIIHSLIKQKICNLIVAKKIAEKYPNRFKDPIYWKLFPDTLKVLETLQKQNHNLYIVSNHVPEAREIISNLKIDHFFDKMFLSYEVGYEKPNKKFFDIARKKAKKSNIHIFIGDNIINDIKGSLNAGFDYAILVRKQNTINHNLYSKTLEGTLLIIDKILKGKL